jgi:hypothetical protein
MKHVHVLHMLNDYVDGLLEEEMKAAVEKHLAACHSCREEFEHLGYVREKIRQLRRISAPPGFLQSIYRRLETEKRPRFSFRTLFTPLHIRVPAGIAALATAAIALIFVLNVMAPRKGMRETVPKRAQETETPLERETASGEPLEMMEGADPSGEDEALKEKKDRPERQVTAGQEKVLEEEDKMEDLITSPVPERAGDEVSIAAEQKPEEYASASAKRAEPGIVRDQTEPVEITLLLYTEKGDPSDREVFGEETRAGGMKSRSAEMLAADEDAADYMAEGPPIEGPPAEGEAAPTTAPDAIISSIEQLVLVAGGRVLSLEYLYEGEIPQSMIVEIPTHAVEAFIDDLMQFGETDLPKEIRTGAYRSRVTDDGEAFPIKIYFE